MSGRGKVQRRMEAVKQVFAESPGRKFTLRELLDALCAGEHQVLFMVEGSTNKRRPHAQKGGDAVAGSLENDASSGRVENGGRKRGPPKPKSEARLNEEAQLQRVKRCVEELERSVPVSSAAGIEQARPAYLIRSRRMNSGKGELVWSSSEALEKEFMSRELDAFSGWAALRAVRDILGWVMPRAVQAEVNMYLEEAEDKFGDLKANGHTARWLNSLTLRPAAYHYFLAQHVDRRIKETIEEAIMLKKKVRLTLDLDDEGCPWDVASENASIYRYVLTLPNIPEIVICPHYEARFEDDDLPNLVECLRIPLSKIQDVVILDESAEFPQPYHALAERELGAAGFGVPSQDGETDVAELRVASWLMSRWMGTWIHKNLEIIGIDLEGWYVCRLVYPRPRRKFHEWSDFGDDLFDFLSMHASGVEILSPPEDRQRFKDGAIASADRYQDENNDG